MFSFVELKLFSGNLVAYCIIRYLGQSMLSTCLSSTFLGHKNGEINVAFCIFLVTLSAYLVNLYVKIAVFMIMVLCHP